MLIAFYFKSRKNFNDKSTWGKEVLPQDYTVEEVATAAKLAGCEGYAISIDGKIQTFKWFTK